ncbi:FGGY-family carbohydrate kinase [Cognatishimia sp. WU-CL00825]|uniref:FGGY-family carbohydrate kinase n=1 Tax=Cognatishimia sp. WU-CL00825 TaxID=3127658 RepID=UPI00310ABA5C
MTAVPKYSNIAVIDIGKTNAKLALVDAERMIEIAVVTRPNRILNQDPYPQFDLEGHWDFLVENLAKFQASQGVDAISVTTHGASVVLLDKDGELVTPMLDYEHAAPDVLAEDYNRLRPSFDETGSPRLSGGLNVGAQLHWLFHCDVDLLDKTEHIITYPQYWGYKLTGHLACDVTSLGCHTDLWNPILGEPSSLVKKLGIEDKLAPARMSSDVLGTVTQEVSDQTGIPTTVPVVCGIHDSNASLVPYLKGEARPNSVVSTGTWVICMSLNDGHVRLDPTKDCLVNVNAVGNAVSSARFMGGREFELVTEGVFEPPAPEDRRAVLQQGIMLQPAVVAESGPFAGKSGGWNKQPQTVGERNYALSLYLALMTNHCLDLAGANDPVVVEGPFAQNCDYIETLAALRAKPVHLSDSATGTSIGAAMLLQSSDSQVSLRSCPARNDQDLQKYCQNWKALTSEK